jgi:hypothetical protein
MLVIFDKHVDGVPILRFPVTYVFLYSNRCPLDSYVEETKQYFVGKRQNRVAHDIFSLIEARYYPMDKEYFPAVTWPRNKCTCNPFATVSYHTSVNLIIILF